MKKYFEYIGETDRTKTGETAKFWEITIEGKTVSVRFGKLGTNGQGSIKQLDSEDAARAYADKKMAEKTKDGYVEKQHQPKSIARGNLMNRGCGCEAKAKSGNIEGIEFEVCTSCEKLSWEPTDTKNFVGIKMNLYVDLENPSERSWTSADFYSWANEVLEDFGHSGLTLYVDMKCLDEEALAEPVIDSAFVPIEIVFSSWDIDVEEDDFYEEGSANFGKFSRSGLANSTTEEIARGAVRNLWDHLEDYLLEESAKSLIEHIESRRFRSSEKRTSQANLGLRVSASIDLWGENLIWSLDEQKWW